MAKLKDLKPKVCSILEQHEKARNNDGTLIAHYLSKHLSRFVHRDPEGKPYIYLSDFQHLPTLESITRARRIIQYEEKKFLPTDHLVARARRIKAEDYRTSEVREAIYYQAND